MNYLSLVALVHIYRDGPQVPDGWLRTTLSEHLGGYHDGDPAAQPRAWAVGGVVGTESLVQMRPVVRDPHGRFTEDFLRAPCQCTLGGFIASGSARPPRFGFTRFQRWIALVGNPGLNPALDGDPTRHRALREELHGGLSPIFSRSLRDGSDRELLGMSVIAKLHAATSASKTYAPPELLREALRSLDTPLGKPGAIDVRVSDGRCVGILQRGGQARLIAPPPADGRRPLIDPDSAADGAHAALILLSPPGTTTPAGAKSGQAALTDEVFTVCARHPVRIGRD